MPTPNATRSYAPSRFHAEAEEILALLSCGQPLPYHVRGQYSVHRRGSYEPLRGSLAEGFWLPARYLERAPARGSEEATPLYVETRRTLTAHAVARHLAGKGWVGAAPPSWVSWFAFDIDLPKSGSASWTLEDAEARRDAVLAKVWEAFEFGPERLPIVLLTPGGGYHVYCPLTRGEGHEQHTWPAHVVRQRVVQRLHESGLRLKDGELELWPCGKILRFPMGRQMCLLEAQNPSDPHYLGLRPVHATWGQRKDRRTGEREWSLRRDIQAGARAFIDAFGASRRSLADWLLEDEADWGEDFGPFAALPSQKNPTLTSRETNVSQQQEEGLGREGDWLLRGEMFRRHIAKLLRTGMTAEGGRHDAALKLTYYFGVSLGLGQQEAMAALEDWLRQFDHVSSLCAEQGKEKFISQTLREARHYYRTHVARIGGGEGRRRFSVGMPLSDADLKALDGQFSCEAVEEAALAILRFIKSNASSLGTVERPVELCTSLLHVLVGDRRVTRLVDDKRRRIRTTQLAVEELCNLGLLTLYKNYRPDHHGRYFCCWYVFGSGALPSQTSSGEVELSARPVHEGHLRLVKGEGRLPRSVPVVVANDQAEERPPPWVQRVYARENFTPGDMVCEAMEARLGLFRDYVRQSSPTEREGTPPDREHGIVTWFADDAGYGFISSEATGESVFVHQTFVAQKGFRTLKAGERVEFTRSPHDKGPRALWVTREEVEAAILGSDATSCS